jgi:hypothetical protein
MLSFVVELVMVNHSVAVPELIHAEMSAYIPSHDWLILFDTVCAFNKYAQGVSALRACEYFNR